jgi:hypothetical protein
MGLQHRYRTIFFIAVNDLQHDGRKLERVKGIEPSSVAWEATALPLSYTRVGMGC